MVLKRLLKWDMVDMTCLSMYKTAQGSRRYDGKELVNAPPFDDLPEHMKRYLCRGSAAIDGFASVAGDRPAAEVDVSVVHEITLGAVHVPLGRKTFIA